jgi:outer membrane murein-binding lipoprotein Lpp
MDDRSFFGRHPTTVIAVLVLAPALFGCGSSDRLKKQVSGLETQLTALRADQDRLEERLAAIELSSSVPSRAAGAGAAAAADRVERPRLKIIHLSPDDQEPAEKAVETPASSAPDAASRRPIIRGTGDRVIKVGDGDSDETTRGDLPTGKRVADLGRASRGN